MFDALQRKSLPDLEAVFAGEQSELQTLLVTLVNLHGGVDVLDRARDSLEAYLMPSLHWISWSRWWRRSLPRTPMLLCILISLSCGGSGTTGLVLRLTWRLGTAVAKVVAMTMWVPSSVATDPPASFDLKALTAASGHQSGAESWISAPESNDPKLEARIRELRAAGRTVVLALNGQSDPRCREQLVGVDGDWICQPLGPREGE